MQRVEISATNAGVPSLPMKGAWRTIRSYIFWQHERGTLHYDIMVTLILLFIFASPYWINFNDKPVTGDPHLTNVIVTPDANGGLLYQISGGAVSPGDDASVRDQLLHIIEPISGAVLIVKYDAIKNQKGNIESYRVWAKRE